MENIKDCIVSSRKKNDTRLSAQKAHEQSIQLRLAQLVSDGKTDAQRDDERTQAAMAARAAEGACRAAEDQLRALGTDPRPAVAVWERQLAGVQGDFAQANEKLHNEEGRLHQITERAPYSELAATEEDLAEAQQRLAEEKLHLDAIRLLYETLQECREEVSRLLVEPVRQRAAHTLARIWGTRFSGVEIASDFTPIGVVPYNQTESVPLKEASGGEREQAYFAVRLALADIVFPAGKQLIVLDDVFAATDALRLMRIAAILQEAAQRFQIVVLTCHPERYRGLPQTTFFDLEALTR
jgi:uncharacterized protein YhaN